MTLSNEFLTVFKRSERSMESVLATQGFNGGKHYWEVTLDMYSHEQDIIVGVSRKELDCNDKAVEQGMFWGWMCSHNIKIEPMPNN